MIGFLSFGENPPTIPQETPQDRIARIRKKVVKDFSKEIYDNSKFPLVLCNIISEFSIFVDNKLMLGNNFIYDEIIEIFTRKNITNNKLQEYIKKNRIKIDDDKYIYKMTKETYYIRATIFESIYKRMPTDSLWDTDILKKIHESISYRNYNFI